MKKYLMTMVAVSALAIGAPAAAQYAGGQNGGQYGGQYPGGDVHMGVQQLQARLQAGVRSGAISRREAGPLDEQIRQISQYERFNGRDGLSGRERSYLQQRIANLREHIRYAEQTGNSRDQRYGRAGYDDRQAYGDRRDYAEGDNGYGRDARVDRNGDGWDDRDLDRDGRIEDARGEEAGAYLRVGERLSGDFDEMPARYRDTYRDGNGSYYRYDRGNVYQVDARTNLILRIFGDGR